MSGIAVGVISWNTRALLRNCLNSALADGPDELIVVDNGSSDGSAEMVSEQFPSVGLRVNPDNPGFGAAANQILSLTRAPYVLLLNADTVLRPGALSALSEYLDGHARVGLIGPRLIHPDGRLQLSCSAFPHPMLPLVRSKVLARTVSRLPWIRDRVLDTWPHDRPRRVPWVSGAAFAVRRTAFDAVGGFDLGFHLYFEEPDISLRMARAGWETHFAPVTDVVHVEGASTGQRRPAVLADWVDSYRYYNERHFSGASLFLARRMFSAGMVVRWFREMTRARLTRDPARRREHESDARIWARALSPTRRR